MQNAECRMQNEGQKNESNNNSTFCTLHSAFSIDLKGNANGRGCHICPACVEKAIKTRALNKSFKANVGDEIYILLAKYASKVYTEKQES